jgi:hypothetical protein
MTSSDITQQRLSSQLIVGPTLSRPEQVVSRLGAMQAQDYAAALWAVALRASDATVADVEQAIASRKIIRTWPMRGTLHFVAAGDVRWMLALLTPRIIAGSAGRARQLDLDQAQFDRSQDVLRRLLADGKPASRPEVMAAFETAGLATAGQRGYHMLWRAAQENVICLGPVAGKQQTFVLLDDWVPASPAKTREEALAELARRYFTGHGPATIQDMMWWSGLTGADVKLGLELAKSTLTSVEAEGNVYWRGREAGPGGVEPGIHLLPGFDEYLLGYRDRDAMLDPAFAQLVCPGGNGMFMPMIVIDGRIVGTWKRTIKKASVRIELKPFEVLPPDRRPEVEAAAARYAAALGLELALQ